MQSIQAFYTYLSQPSTMVVTMHQKPDGDAMGSTLALYHFLTRLGHSVTVVSPTNWANFLNWMPGVDKVVDFEKYPVKATEIVKKWKLFYKLVRLRRY
jgi:bifunctional oligoribonuclease and PAP phosphatase NrnA